VRAEIVREEYAMPIDTATPGGFPPGQGDPEELGTGTTTGTTVDAEDDDATTTGDGHPPRAR
jgi:hypothetical protein